MIRFKMDTKDLAESITAIMPCVAASKSVIKISLLNRRAKAENTEEGNIIMFLCYDEKKQFATFSTAYEVQMEEKVREMYVDGKSFSSLAMILGQREGFAAFEVDKHMTVDGANSRIDFALLDGAAILVREKNALYQINMESRRLKAVLRRGGYAAVGNKTQVNLRYTALKFDKREGTITVCSSNGNMIAVDACSNVMYNDTEYPEVSHTILVEGDQLKTVLKNLTDDNTLLEVYENQILFRNGLNICLLRTSDDSYPTEALLKMAEKQKRKCEMKVSVAELLNAMDIINVAKIENIPICVMKDVGDNHICLQTRSGNGRTNIEVQKTESFSEVAFNADYFKMIISNFDKGAEIFMGVGETDEMIIIKKEKEYAGISCLLPVKTKN